jgi:putative membrane protein
MTKIYNYLSLISIGVYIIYLNQINRLAFLIHPRYLWLSLAAAGLVVIVGLVGLFHIFKNQKAIFRSSKSFLSWSFIIMLVSFGVFLVPIKSLSIESFNLRSSKSNVNFTEKEKAEVKLKIKEGVDSSSFWFFDWVNAKTLNENGIFKDKKFKGSGFVTAGTQANTFGLSRFIISCCVVDATPVSLLVEYDYAKENKLNDLLEIEGSFVIKPIDGVNQPVIVPSSVKKIPEPDSVYLERT